MVRHSPFGTVMNSTDTRPYCHLEHCHRFAAWSAAQAARRGQAGFSNAVVKQALDGSSHSCFIESQSRKPISAAEFDAQHRLWAGKLSEAFDRHCGAVSYGRVAKVIAIYIKSMVVLQSPESSLAHVAHPPVDGILLHASGIRGAAWTKLDEPQYWTLIEELRALVGKELPFWSIESHWALDR
jgi:hypothetical protein